MKTEMLSTRIDFETKHAFTLICQEMGMSPSQAIKIFARAVINHGGIPFDVKAKQPNEATLAAIKELESGKGVKFESFEHLSKELEIGELSDVNN